MQTCDVYRLGCMEYGTALELQRDLAARRMTRRIGDCLCLGEHPPVVTLGHRSHPEDLRLSAEELSRRGVALYAVERGGQVTYHGPGQLVGYPILDLTARGRDVHRYVRDLEEVLLRTLADFGIQGIRVRGRTGVWVGDEKVASIGVRISRWTTWHGFALNVTTDLTPFGWFVPCGLPRVRMTSMARLLGCDPGGERVLERVVWHFGRVFALEPVIRDAAEIVMTPSLSV